MARQRWRRGVGRLAGGAALLAACSGGPADRVRPADEGVPTITETAWAGPTSFTPELSEDSSPALVHAAYEARGPEGLTIAIAARYRVPASVEDLYGANVARGTLVVAVEVDGGRVYAASADPPGREDSAWALDPEAAAASEGSVLSAQGAFNADLRALLDLPGDPAEYDVFLWLGTMTSSVTRVTLPAAARAGRAATRRPTLEIEISAAANPPPALPELETREGCLAVEARVSRSANGPLVLLAGVPELLAVRGAALTVPTEGADAFSVRADLCPLLDELPGRSLDVHMVALRGGALSPVRTHAWYPGASLGARVAGELPCHSDDECVLVTGGDCARADAVHRLAASELDARNRASLATRSCGGEQPIAVYPRCLVGHCASVAHEHPEWRRCQSDRDCVALRRSCDVWEPVARGHESDASRDIESDDRAAGDCPPSRGPDIACGQGACLLGWAGP